MTSPSRACWLTSASRANRLAMAPQLLLQPLLPKQHPPLPPLLPHPQQHLLLTHPASGSASLPSHGSWPLAWAWIIPPSPVPAPPAVSWPAGHLRRSGSPEGCSCSLQQQLPLPQPAPAAKSDLELMDGDTVVKLSGYAQGRRRAYAPVSYGDPACHPEHQGGCHRADEVPEGSAGQDRQEVLRQRSGPEGYRQGAASASGDPGQLWTATR